MLSTGERITPRRAGHAGEAWKDGQRPRLSGLGPEALGRLLRFGLGKGRQEPAEEAGDERAAVMQGFLEETVTGYSAAMGMVPVIARHFYQEVLKLSERSVGELVTSATTNVDVLRAIKQQSKDAASTSNIPAERDVHTVLYYAAIASALVFHNTIITELGFAELKKAMDQLNQKDWVPLSLKELFHDGSAICAKRIAEE